jgi:hypothetical protein
MQIPAWTRLIGPDRIVSAVVTAEAAMAAYGQHSAFIFKTSLSVSAFLGRVAVCVSTLASEAPSSRSRRFTSLGFAKLASTVWFSLHHLPFRI